eukprot:TRINITY_DN4365_c0_g1_i1.p1 TRINITY_DN4365_c0_g1~~TRINITY_DN4365_c0_g1_i1.p1  ORF type:complete len:200 (-),score=61.08 TRINITY_DN4365_c0_g1_i1:169-732(-)
METVWTNENSIEKVIISEQQIHDRNTVLAEMINKDYAGKELVLVGILKGSFIFMADLSRKITVPHSLEFMAVSSYGNSHTSSGDVRILMDVRQSLVGKHVVIVEDICDTGLTLKYLFNNLKARQPASVQCAVFLRKKGCLKVNDLEELKYVGFEIDPVFVVGYGLDYAEKYRSLPYVGELKEAVYKK